MSRSIPLLVLLFVPLATWAQSDTARTKVVKSAPIEMKAAGTTVSSKVSSMATASEPAITGDFTVSSAHPKCVKGATTGERAKCTAAEVLATINGHLKAERPKSLDVVSVDFDVDEYGDVKKISTNTSTEPGLGKALIVALYDLPKFEAAKKGDKRTVSHCSFSYAVDALFQPANTAEAATAPVDTAAKPAAVVPSAPATTTVTSNGQTITGRFTVPSMHPQCTKGRTAEERTQCTADQVLLQIKAQLKATAPEYMDVVVVDFDIDEYGDVKTIRANCSSEPDLGKAVIVALYGLPKFIPAKNNAARAASHCTFSYPVASLFAKP